MPAGRPTDYNEEIVAKVDLYLEVCQDEDRQVVKQSNSEKGYEMYENKLTVSLPTIEGLASYLDVHKDTLYEWEKKYPEFSDALEKVRVEQKTRLINMGLAGEYNSTIAKLILSSNHGMAEKTEVDQNTKHSLDEKSTDILSKVYGG